MTWLGKFVVRYRKAIIITYAVLLIPAIIGFFLTQTNYDILSYMPDEFNSKQGEKVLEEEFALSGLGLIMIRDKPGWQVEKFISEIEPIDGVDRVAWLGDYADIHVPIDFIEPVIKERFTAGDSVLLQVQFTENARTEKTNLAVSCIKEKIGGDPDILFGGEPVIISEMGRLSIRRFRSTLLCGSPDPANSQSID